MSVRSKARGLLQGAVGSGLSHAAWRLVDKASVVSFDVFDTLVVRDCPEPAMVFDIVERRYNRAHPDACVSDFRRLRVAAEGIARQALVSDTPSIEQIYSFLGGGLEGAAQELLSFEVDTERKICRANPEVKALYDYAVASGKRVVIASDMYLGEKEVGWILSACGYSRYERLYVSCDLSTSKRNGGLFRILLGDCHVNQRDVLHIGDHLMSDWLIPLKLGMRSYLYERKRKSSRLFLPRPSFGWIGDPVDNGILESVIQQGISRYEDDDCAWMGYAVLGPIILGYTLWLHDIYEHESGAEIWFLSREGALLKRAWDVLYGKAALARYLNVSRVALCRTAVPDMDNFDQLLSLFGVLMKGVDTVGDFLEILGLGSMTGEVRRLGIAWDAPLVSADQDRLFNFIRCRGRELHSGQRELLLNYLGVTAPDSPKRVIVSDIGWSGTMQALFGHLLPEWKLIGAYLAVSNFFDGDCEYLNRSSLDRRGFWCNSTGWKHDGQVIRFTQSAIESMFLSEEGTTLGYVREGSAVIPVKDTSSITSESRSATEKLQAAAVAFVADIAARGTQELLGGIKKTSAMLPYINTVVFPKGRALGLLENFTFRDGALCTTLLPKRSLPYYVTHPRGALAELKLSNSKVVWLRGAFGLPLPYYRILNLLSSLSRRS